MFTALCVCNLVVVALLWGKDLSRKTSLLGASSFLVVSESCYSVRVCLLLWSLSVTIALLNSFANQLIPKRQFYGAMLENYNAFRKKLIESYY